MEVPVGFISKLWSFLSFLPFFFSLLLLGLLKGVIICPVVGIVIGFGNSAVIIGLWPAHFIWTCYCVAKTKRLGLVLKILVLVLLPVPLLLWPIFGIVGSILGGILYGFFAPLIATFETVGENVTDKCFHCFVDGCWPTIKGSCMVVRDFTDFCFHSYFSYMDELSEEMPADEKPIDIRLSKLPSCLLVIPLALTVDVPFITAVALWKGPYMLFKGWKRLLEDLIGREGPFLETVCVPFAALAIMLWPLAVVGAVISAFFASFFLGLYSAVIVQQEDSLQMGLAYIMAVISLFDEYTNDLLYLREGSCFPRPRYRRNMSPGVRNGQQNGREGSYNSKLVSQQSRTLKWTIQQSTPIQVWDWLFKSCEENGRILLREGLIDVKDLEECIAKGDCKKLGIKLPAWSILECLLASANSMSEKENPLQAIFQTFEKISHGVRTYLSQFAYLTDNNYPSPTNGQPLFSLFSSFKANPLIASEHSTLFRPKEILNELKDYQSSSDSMFEKENPLQSIFQTFEKISHGVRIYLSQFACLTNNNYPSPTNGRPLFSLSSSFKANPLIASEHSTLFRPKEILNEGKSATPVTKEELGKATWTFLHTLAAQYPDNPTRQQRKDVKELMEILSRMYPCKDCADHFKEILRANPVQAGSQAEFSQWLCHAHNVVNRSLGKLVFPCERVDARWGKMECEQRACDLQGTTTFFGDNMR